ncbi:TIR domain-containing protein [Desulfosporosinus sp. OT]|uniref:TIR domain-containing protein n=1 Tax=Desulfosporosinus sp. OT TaxID=913865 RepID=UPI000223A8A1|nr:TIR domain-containing protein [Desulfosporosinus sp. OT]EGW40479.1 hypothetical protein DOT_1551 [Desulfosporosinus sp. OT]
MINIFLAYCSKDKTLFATILDNLQPLSKCCEFWYYNQDSDPITMDEIIKTKLPRTDLFVVFITNNSLNSDHIQREIFEAKNLSKEICPIIIDNSITANSDARIPEFINSIYYASPPINAIQIIEDELEKINVLR